MKQNYCRFRTVAICSVLTLLLAGQSVSALTSATIDYQTSTGANNTRIGYTYERQGDEYNAAATDQARVDETVKSSLSMQARHVIGFGTGNIWLDPRDRDPNSSAWNWQGLDDRINRMRASAGSGGAELVLTAGMAPNWMTTMEGHKDETGNYYPNNNPVLNYTEYPDIDGDGIVGEKYEDNPVAPANQDKVYGDEQAQPPDPWYEDDFAYMIEQVARRYPDVKIWNVWNEFKGLYRQDLGRWDYERYTRLYNKVYTSLKNVNSANKVGGPYLAFNIWTPQTPGNEPTSRTECRGDWGIMAQREIGNHQSDTQTSVLGYWMKHKVGADFITFSWGTKSWRAPNDPFNQFQVKQRIDGIMQCIRSVKDETGTIFPDAQTLPVGAAEFYANVPTVSETENGANDPASETERAAIMANAAGEMISAKYDHLMFWDLMTSKDGGVRSCDPTNTAGTLTLLINPTSWKCTDNPSLRGNESTIAPILRQMKTTFATGNSTMHPANFDTTKVGVFASNRGTMIVNRQNSPEEIAINSCSPIALAPFEVRFVGTMNCSSPGGSGTGSGGSASGGTTGEPGTTGGQKQLADTGYSPLIGVSIATIALLAGITKLRTLRRR